MIRTAFLHNHPDRDMEDRLEQIETGGTGYYSEAFALS